MPKLIIDYGEVFIGNDDLEKGVYIKENPAETYDSLEELCLDDLMKDYWARGKLEGDGFEVGPLEIELKRKD